MEAKWEALSADTEYLRMGQEHANNWVAGSFHDQVLKSV
jgi:hypothetical protein